MPKETVKRQGMQHADTPWVARAIGLVLLSRVPPSLRQRCVSSGFPIRASLRTWVCDTETAAPGGGHDGSEGHAASLLPKAHDGWVVSFR